MFAGQPRVVCESWSYFQNKASVQHQLNSNYNQQCNGPVLQKQDSGYATMATFLAVSASAFELINHHPNYRTTERR
jgi:hypothetical protein